MRTAVLIPFASVDGYRCAALDWVRMRWRIQGYEPIVGRGDTAAWSKAAAVRDALDRSDADVLVVADADVWCNEIARAIRAVETGATRWAVPHRLVVRLTEAATRRVYAGEPLSRQLPAVKAHATGVVGGGIVVLTRELYNDVPLDPRFIGWGGEDHAWGYALHHIAGPCWRNPDADLFHLWHRSDAVDDAHFGSSANDALYRRYRDAHGRARHADLTPLRGILEEIGA
jgi:hypothetical protein